MVSQVQGSGPRGHPPQPQDEEEGSARGIFPGRVTICFSYPLTQSLEASTPSKPSIIPHCFTCNSKQAAAPMASHMDTCVCSHACVHMHVFFLQLPGPYCGCSNGAAPQHNRPPLWAQPGCSGRAVAGEKRQGLSSVKGFNGNVPRGF